MTATFHVFKKQLLLTSTSPHKHVGITTRIVLLQAFYMVASFNCVSIFSNQWIE